jgi:hypothetical protein
MKILIFGVKKFQHIYPPLNRNRMSFTKSVFPLFVAYQGNKDTVFRVIIEYNSSLRDNGL